MTGRPIFSLPRIERIELVRRAVGMNVSVDVDGSRDGDCQVVEGTLLAVARPMTGAQTDAAIVRRRDGETFSISLATIRNLFVARSTS